jgi:pimeloyl-ACP methyl ester carboxylesterase
MEDRLRPLLLTAGLLLFGSPVLCAIAAAQAPSVSLQSYVGDFRLPDGAILVIGRALGQLVYLEPTQSHQGPLVVRDSGRFEGWTSFANQTPRYSATFLRDKSQHVEGVRWRDLLTDVEVIGRRVDLYTIDSVRFANGPVHLAGSILRPRNGGGNSGVVLVHGSNAQSRYGQRGHLWLHADHLARNGITVLVYDKRGIGGSGGNSNDPGLDADALAALRVLRRSRGVDPSRVGLWGISQGAWIVGEVAAKAPLEVAFVVAVGGGGVNGEIQDVYRTQAQLRADGFAEGDIRRATRIQRLKWHFARTRQGWEEYVAAVDSARGQHWLGDPYIGPPTDRASDAWDFWARMLTPGTGYGDPTYWERVRCPVLAVIGELDAVSPPDETLISLDRMLQRAGNTRVTLMLVPKASHSLYEASTGGPRDPIGFSRFAPGYLHALIAWLGAFN